MVVAVLRPPLALLLTFGLLAGGVPPSAPLSPRALRADDAGAGGEERPKGVGRSSRRP